MKYKIVALDGVARMNLLGSIFVVGISIPCHEIGRLGKMGIQIGCQPTRSETEKLANKLIDHFDFEVDEIPAEKINRSNVNYLETKSFLWCLKRLDGFSDKIFVNNFEFTKERLVDRFKKICEKDMIMENWMVGDRLHNQYIQCTAARILANFYRNYQLDSLKEEYGEVGSGNVNDPKTIGFLKRNLSRLPDFIRTKYLPIKQLLRKI